MKSKSLHITIIHKSILYSLYGLVMQLLLVAPLPAMENAVYAQKSVKETFVTIDFDRDHLRTVFKKIESKTDFRFSYHFGDIDKRFQFTGSYQNTAVYEILVDLSRAAKLSFKNVNGNIGVQPVKQAMKPTVTEVQIEISGRVTDETGEGLPGASVVEKGTANGTTTDMDGNYRLTVSEGAVLAISFVGYATQEIAVGNQSIIDVQMVLDISELEEIVVVGFGSQKKANVSGAVTTVEMDEVIGDRPINNTAEALQGVIPGLQITSSAGEPGAEGIGINLRGATSINGGSPLVLVDNVPVSLNDINPRDIESITVLKDAAASSIYGARAAFGVILITTKKPEGRVEFNYALTTSIAEPTEVPEAASPLEFVTALDEWGRNPFWALGEDTDTWLGFLEQYQANPALFPDGFAEEGGIRYRLASTDHPGNFFSDNGFTQIHNFSFGASNDRSAYRLSLGYNDEDGIMISDNDAFTRYNLNGYISSEIAPNLKAELTTIYRNSEKIEPKAAYSDIIGFPSFLRTGLHENADGTFTPYDTPDNRVNLEAPNTTENENIRLFGRLQYNPITNLTLTGEYTYESRNREQVRIVQNPIYVRSARLGLTGGNVEQTSFRNTRVNANYRAINLYANYNKTLLERHNLSLLAGFNSEEEEGSSLFVNRTRLVSADLPSISTTSGDITADDGFYEWAVMGVFGRLNYNYMEKYSVELNARYDGSSRFAEGDRFGFFPSVSASWNITRESFFQSLPLNVISNFKFRGSWGEIGNQRVTFPGTNTDNYYPTVAGLPTFNSEWIDVSSNVRYLSLGAPDLVSAGFTWETVRTLNFGIDLGLFDNRLNATFDIYRRETLDMITAGAELPSVLGADAPVANAADLRTNGWELDLSWRDNIGQVGYQIGINLYDSKATITKFDNEEGLLVINRGVLQQFYEGQVLGEIWGYTTDGYFTVDDFEAGSLSDDLTGGTLNEGVPSFLGISENPGDIKYADLNGDGEIFSGNSTLDDPGDLSIIGNNTRRYQFGINGSANYKNFDLSFFINGVAKRDIVIDNDLYWPFINQFDNIFKHQLDYWTPENTDAFYPRNYSFDNSNYVNSRRVQTKYLADGRYWTLRNVTIGYTFPSQLLERVFISSLRFFVSGENLFLKDNLPDGLHPELADRGNGAAYPFQRKYALGLNLRF